jgi:hypothetical protein
MSRTVAALYSTRAEAETAQARLRNQFQTTSTTIIGQYLGEGLEAFRFSDEDRSYYQEALSRGDYLLCAQVPSGQDPERLVQALQESTSIERTKQTDPLSARAPDLSEADRSAPDQAADRVLFVGEAWIARGGAQVTYTAPKSSGQASSRSSFSPPGARRLYDQELQGAGLLQDRTVEASAMGEVPVITRRPVVREEVVIRKAAEERTEIIRDTVRRTASEVTDLGSEPGGRDQRQPLNER